MTNDGAENYNGQINSNIGKHPNLGLFLNALYQFNCDFYTKNANDINTRISVENRYPHFSELQSKAETNRLLPNCWPKQLKPRLIRRLPVVNIDQISSTSLPNLLDTVAEIIPRVNQNLSLNSKIITTGPAKHVRKAGSTQKNTRKRRSENTREFRILSEMARVDRNAEILNNNLVAEEENSSSGSFDNEEIYRQSDIPEISTISSSNHCSRNTYCSIYQSESESSDNEVILEKTIHISNLTSSENDLTSKYEILSRIRDKPRRIFYRDRSNSAEEEEDETDEHENDHSFE